MVSRQRLLRLLMHSNILSRDVQYVLGGDNWIWDMSDYIPHIDLQKPESIGDHVSSYLGVTDTPDKDGNLTDLYNGSATCVSPNKGLVGEAARMISGHRRTLKMGYDKIRRRRRDPNIENHKEIFIHEKMAYPEAKYIFITTACYPIISSQCLKNKAKVLAVLAESPPHDTPRDHLQREETIAPEGLTKASGNDVSRHISQSTTSMDAATSVGWHKQVAAYFPKLAPCLGTSHRRRCRTVGKTA